MPSGSSINKLPIPTANIPPLPLMPDGMPTLPPQQNISFIWAAQAE